MKAGETQRVRVSYGEGSATHAGPESCACLREESAADALNVGEALTGEDIGRVLSRERQLFRGADVLSASEGNTPGTAKGKVHGDPARSETPCMCGSVSHGNREIPRLAPADGAGVRVVNPKGARRR